jgi:hypothetical protein
MEAVVVVIAVFWAVTSSSTLGFTSVIKEHNASIFRGENGILLFRIIILFYMNIG